MKEKTTPPPLVLVVEKMVVLEVALGSWFTDDDNEKLVWFKTFPLRFDSDYIWQVLGSVANLG